jgi:hypothetical protein
MKGTVLTADKLIKLDCMTEHRLFTADIQGLKLLDYIIMESKC